MAKNWCQNITDNMTFWYLKVWFCRIFKKRIKYSFWKITNYLKYFENTLKNSDDLKCSAGYIRTWTIIRAKRAVCKVTSMILRCRLDVDNFKNISNNFGGQNHPFLPFFIQVMPLIYQFGLKCWFWPPKWLNIFLNYFYVNGSEKPYQ